MQKGWRSAVGHQPEIIVYCGVDEPYASEVFKEFEKQSGLHVAPRYDIESSKSVTLAGKLTAEKTIRVPTSGGAARRSSARGWRMRSAASLSIRQRRRHSRRVQRP